MDCIIPNAHTTKHIHTHSHTHTKEKKMKFVPNAKKLHIQKLLLWKKNTSATRLYDPISLNIELSACCDKKGPKRIWNLTELGQIHMECFSPWSFLFAFIYHSKFALAITSNVICWTPLGKPLSLSFLSLMSLSRFFSTPPFAKQFSDFYFWKAAFPRTSCALRVYRLISKDISIRPIFPKALYGHPWQINIILFPNRIRHPHSQCVANQNVSFS